VKVGPIFDWSGIHFRYCFSGVALYALPRVSVVSPYIAVSLHATPLQFIVFGFDFIFVKMLSELQIHAYYFDVKNG